MSFHAGDKVVVNKDIVRHEGPYAQKGMFGEILEIFYSGLDTEKRLNAKVLIDGKIYTFRLTSLDRVEEN